MKVVFPVLLNTGFSSSAFADFRTIKCVPISLRNVAASPDTERASGHERLHQTAFGSREVSPLPGDTHAWFESRETAKCINISTRERAGSRLCSEGSRLSQHGTADLATLLPARTGEV